MNNVCPKCNKPMYHDGTQTSPDLCTCNQNIDIGIVREYDHFAEEAKEIQD